MPHLPISVGSQWVPKEGGEWGIEAIIHGSKKNQSPIVREHRKMDAIPFAISELNRDLQGVEINGEKYLHLLWTLSWLNKSKITFEQKENC